MKIRPKFPSFIFSGKLVLSFNIYKIFKNIFRVKICETYALVLVALFEKRYIKCCIVGIGIYVFTYLLAKIEFIA